MMRTRSSRFRPALEAAEPRLLTTAGLVSAAHPHPGVVSAEAHHAKPVHHHASKPTHAASPTTSAASTAPVSGGVSHAPGTTSNPYVAGAWVELINMTGSAVSYSISLAPFENGQYQNFAIGAGYPNPAHYQFAALTASGAGSVAHFQVEFSGGSPVTLATGPTQASAKVYGIFDGTDGVDYVVPLVT